MASAENTAVLKKKKEKASKYNALQNTWFMIKLAWTSKEKKVLVLSLLAAGLALANNLINLYVSPSILAVLERKGSIPELLWTIAAFTLGIMLVSAANSLTVRSSPPCQSDLTMKFSKVLSSKPLLLSNRKLVRTL